MRRSLACRAFSLVLALWIPLFMGGAESVVRCPMHGAAIAATGHSGHAAAAPAHDHAGDRSMPPDHGRGHGCSCPGAGCGATAVALPSRGTIQLAHAVAVHEAAAIATLTRFARDRAYLLPFATAPPAAALAPAASVIG